MTTETTNQAIGMWGNFTIGGCHHSLVRFDTPGEVWIHCLKPNCDYVEVADV
jgi:hypothetical protein